MAQLSSSSLEQLNRRSTGSSQMSEGIDGTTDRPKSNGTNQRHGIPGFDGHDGLLDVGKPKLGFRDRIKHFTFAWFTLTMATTGLAHVLHTGLYAIGCMFMIFGLVFFLTSCVMMGLRFFYYPKAFKAAFLHPTESLFIPAFILAIGSIFINITEYGLDSQRSGMWLANVMTVMYWIYISLAFISSCGIYLTMWSTQMFTIAQMTPIWTFPAYSMLLAGPFAGVLCTPLEENYESKLPIIVGGFIVQGIGFMLSVMIYSAYMYRLFTQKLPNESTRPGMFISVGPSGFTCSALITMGSQFPTTLPPAFMKGGSLIPEITQVLAYWSGIWLYGLAVWFFCVSVFAHWSCVRGERLSFAMSWYGFVFPNTALTAATFNVAEVLGRNLALEVVGCVMTCALVFVWSIVLGMNVRAVALGQVLWPEKGEDRDEDMRKPGSESSSESSSEERRDDGGGGDVGGDSDRGLRQRGAR